MRDSIIQKGKEQVVFPKMFYNKVHQIKLHKRSNDKWYICYNPYHNLHESKVQWDVSRYLPLVKQMLKNHDVPSTINGLWLTVDEATVNEGEHHRREGLHIDGYWDENNCWRPRGKNYKLPKNDSEARKIKLTENTDEFWETAEFDEDCGVILASNVLGSQGFKGIWNGGPKSEGNCEHVDVSNMERIPFNANNSYAGNVLMLHETTPIPRGPDNYSFNHRQMARLIIPGWTPNGYDYNFIRTK